MQTFYQQEVFCSSTAMTNCMDSHAVANYNNITNLNQVQIRSTAEENKRKFSYLGQRHSNLHMYINLELLKCQNTQTSNKSSSHNMKILQELMSCCCNQIPWQL